MEKRANEKMPEPKDFLQNMRRAITTLSVAEKDIAQPNWKLTIGHHTRYVEMIQRRALLLSDGSGDIAEIEVGENLCFVFEEYLNANGRAFLFRLFMVAYFEQRAEESSDLVERIECDLGANRGANSLILRYFSTEELVETLNWLFWYVFEDGPRVGIAPEGYLSQKNSYYLAAVRVLAQAIEARM